MHHMTVLECRVAQGKMQEFVSRVQQWGQDARDHADGPEFHGVYLLESDPGRVLVITQFPSKARADAFAATGMPDRFRASISGCTATPPSELEGFDLFYAFLDDGSRIVFGEDG